MLFLVFELHLQQRFLLHRGQERAYTQLLIQFAAFSDIHPLQGPLFSDPSTKGSSDQAGSLGFGAQGGSGGVLVGLYSVSKNEKKKGKKEKEKKEKNKKKGGKKGIESKIR